MGDSHENIYEAFFAAQQEMGNAKKGSDNPFFKSRYADLNSVREAVMPSLMEQGICVIQPEVVVEGRNYVRTVLMHVKSETSISSDVEILYTKPNDPQAQGSAITYARRYGLQSICGIGAEDDDGNTASGNVAAKPKGPEDAKPKAQSKTAFQEAWIRNQDAMDKIFETLDRTNGDTEATLKGWYTISPEMLATVIEKYNSYKECKKSKS